MKPPVITACVCVISGLCYYNTVLSNTIIFYVLTLLLLVHSSSTTFRWLLTIILINSANKMMIFQFLFLYVCIHSRILNIFTVIVVAGGHRGGRDNFKLKQIRGNDFSSFI